MLAFTFSTRQTATPSSSPPIPPQLHLYHPHLPRNRISYALNTIPKPHHHQTNLRQQRTTTKTHQPATMSTAAVLDPYNHLPTSTTPDDSPAPPAPPPVPSLPSRLALTHALNNPDLASNALTPGHIFSSPYPSPTHTLDLSRVPLQSALFARALQSLTPASVDYATQPYQEGFAWDALFARLREIVADEGVAWRAQDFYVVTFKSVLKEHIDRDHLGLLDEKSHEEAVESGGLLKYWFGVPDAQRRNLATCEFDRETFFGGFVCFADGGCVGLWHSREDAANGGRGPWHKKARAAAGVMYESIRFETRRLTVEEGVSGWTWEDWKH